ncbi:MAG: ABC transporter ATP-binding protein [bacterium]
MELHFDGLTLATRDRTRLIAPTTVTISPGVTALLGSNGAGKSTLLRAIVALHPLEAGTVRLGRYDHRRDHAEFLAHAVFMPQNFTAYPDLTAKEFLTYFLRLRGVSKVEANQRASYWLSAVGLEKATNQRTGVFSQGMLQRVGFAYAMQSEAALYVMDEPFAGVDPEGRAALTDLMFDVARDRVVLLSTHHIEEVTSRGAAVARIADGALSLETGHPA